MSGQIVITPEAGTVFVARDDSGLTGTGITPEAAVANLRLEAERKAKREAMVVGEPEGDHPWLRFAGTWDANDPVIQEWRKAVEEYRQSVDDDPNVL